VGGALSSNRDSTPVPLLGLLGLAGLAFLVLASYEVARPAVESLFLEAYTSEGLPWVWLAVGVTAFIVVLAYNRVVARVGLVSLFGRVAALSAAALILIQLAIRAEVPGSVFALYVWKDVYVVVLVEIFWSFANTVIPTDRAKWLYGIFCAVGALGAMSGNLLVGLVAKEAGTSDALWLVVPILLVAALLCRGVDRALRAESGERMGTSKSVAFGDGLKVVGASRYLRWMVALIIFTQLVVNLVDFQFNSVIESFYPETDARTAVIGQVYAAINLASFVLQLGAGLALSVLGVSRSLLAIPLIVGSTLLVFLIMPGFAAIALAKVASKAFDYSIFRAAKELLYIPLGYTEKTQGKAVVDILTYRVAKGGASAMLIALGLFGVADLALGCALVCVVLWVVAIRKLMPLYTERLEAHESDSSTGP
jgi:AAA family ATP:ADP antiporter